MTMKANLGQLMEQAKEMQERMQKAQEELANLTIVGESGAGMVKVTMNGRHDVRKVELASEALDESKEVLEDLIAAAINSAVQKVEASSKEKIKSFTQGLDLPVDLSDEDS